MEARTCPNCGYKYSVAEYLKKPFLKGIYSQWHCTSCRTNLTSVEKRRWYLSFIGVFPVVLTPYIAEWLLSAGFSTAISWTSAIFILAFWTFFIFSFEKFELAQSNRVGIGESSKEPIQGD